MTTLSIIRSTKGAKMSVKTEEMDEEVMLGWAGAGDIVPKKQ